ncbi:MAG: hypothetical protein U0Y68_24840 [Blastocatellia bacterium]
MQAHTISATLVQIKLQVVVVRIAPYAVTHTKCVRYTREEESHTDTPSFIAV